MVRQYRVDHVGSLLRPAELLEARSKHAAGKFSIDDLRTSEDQAIRGALETQRKIGLPILSDGEFRRESWLADMASAVEGFIPQRIALEWKGPGGAVEG